MTAPMEWLRNGLLALGLLAGLSAAAATGAARAAEPEKDGPWSFRVGGELGVRYDDNIISLSERDQDFLEANPEAGKERFGVETPDDMVAVPEVSFGLNRDPGKGERETGLTFLARSYQYLDNSIKSYEVLSLTLRQDLNTSREHGTRLTVGLSHIPEYFVRRLIDEDASLAAGTTIRNDVTYDKLEARVAVSQEIVNRYFDLEAGYAWAQRDYNDNFNERDSDADTFSLEAHVYPFGDIGLRVRPYYERESRDAEGDIPSLVVLADDDVGYDSNLYGLNLRWLWGADRTRRNSLAVYYEYEGRDYPTTNTVDVGHYGREDQIDKYGLSYEREFGPQWGLVVSGYHRENEVSFPDGRSTPYPKNVITATVGYRFDGPL